MADKRKAVRPNKPRPGQPTLTDTLRTLSEAWGPAGFEHRVREQIHAIVAPLADHVEVDALGNLICSVGSGGKRIMVAAHMDEIGLIATFVEKKTGYVRFSPLGGLMNTALLGSRVQFEDGTIGTLCMPDYFRSARQAAPALEAYYIDVSDGGPEPGRIQPGMAAAFERGFFTRGNRLIGKALDDRAGCAVAIEAMRQLAGRAQNTISFVFTVQEEVGVRGARTAAHAVAPDIGIALDVTPTGDMISVEKNDVRLGGGAAIKLHDPSLIVPPVVRDWMIERAEADGIRWQPELITLGGTDGSAMQEAQAGAPTGVISIPCRYVHTTSETVDSADMEACVGLLVGLLTNPAP